MNNQTEYISSKEFPLNERFHWLGLSRFSALMAGMAIIALALVYEVDAAEEYANSMACLEIQTGIELTLSTIPGIDYQLEFSTNNSVWNPWGSLFPGTTNLMTAYVRMPEHYAIWRLAPTNASTSILTATSILFWPNVLGGNDHWYEIIKTPQVIRWNDARKAATNRGGYLATVTSPGEQRMLFNLINISKAWRAATTWNQAISGPWIGAYQLDNQTHKAQGWQWVDGETWLFAGWHQYPNVNDPTVVPEPTNGGIAETSGNREKYAQFWRHRLDAPDYVGWNDAGDGEPVYSYVVEYDLRPGTTLSQEVVLGHIEIGRAVRLRSTISSQTPIPIECSIDLADWQSIDTLPDVMEGYQELWREADSPQQFYRPKPMPR